MQQEKMRKAITQYTIIFLLFQISSSSNNIRTYKSSLHRENGSEKLKPQTKSANLNHNIASICVLPITEVVHTDLYGSVPAAINAVASKDVLPQKMCLENPLKNVLASKSMLASKDVLPQNHAASKDMLPRNPAASKDMLPRFLCCLKKHATCLGKRAVVFLFSPS
jgi:hypothetical protein